MDLEPYDLVDIEAGLEWLGRQEPSPFETAFPNSGKMIKAVKRAKALRPKASRSKFAPCGECEDCCNDKFHVTTEGMVVVVAEKGRSVRTDRSKCFELWRLETTSDRHSDDFS